jgi:hypothetical protein
VIEFDDYEFTKELVAAATDKFFELERATLIGSYSNIIKAGGMSLATSVEAKGVGFVGPAGIGAFSAATSFSMAKATHDAVLEERKNEEFAIGQQHCIVHPKFVVEVKIENVKLVHGALSKINDMYAQVLANGGAGGGMDKIKVAVKPLIENFLKTYGSHVYLSATLGGIFIRRAQMQVKDETRIKDAKLALSNLLKSSASTSGSYAGPGGFGSGGVAGAGGNHQEEAKSNVDISQQHLASQYLVTEKIGGQLTKDNVDLWKQSLGYSGNWHVIDRANVIAVWDIVQDRHGKSEEKREKETKATCFFTLCFNAHLFFSI